MTRKECVVLRVCGCTLHLVNRLRAKVNLKYFEGFGEEQLGRRVSCLDSGDKKEKT